jgi:PAS domain S-box-containing protein
MAEPGPVSTGALEGVGGPTLDELYCALFERSAECVVITKLSGEVVRANGAACRACQVSEEEFRRGGRAERVVPDAALEALLAERERTGAARGVLTLRRGDGTTFPAEVSSSVILTRGGERFTCLMFRDLTEPRRADAALRESEERFRLLANAMPQIVCVLRPDGTPEYVNPSWISFAGLDAAASARMGWDRSVHPDDVRLARECLARVMKTFAPQDVELRYRAADGSHRWFLCRLAPVVEDGRVVRLVGAGMDIEARRRAEEALRESEEKLRLAKDAAGMGAWNWDLVTGELVWTDRCRALFGLAPDDPVSYDVFKRTIHPDDVAPIEDALRDALRTGNDYDAVMRVPLPDGSVRWVAAKGRAFFDAQRRPVRMAGMAVDITERKRVEEQLQEANDALREAARRKDEFLGMLSHELRNPLAPIRNSTYILRHADPGSEQARRAQMVIERQTDHLTRLVDDLLDVTRIARGKIDLRRSRVDLREVVSHAADDYRVTMRDRGIRFEVDIPAEPLWASADPTRLTQLVGNLLHNAAKFARRDDEVTVRVRAAGREGEIRVRDTGAGIEPALLRHVFDAFVQGERTLARAEGGLGLGLALVKGIAELHGGTVEALSAGTGRGAEFIVRLPLAPATAARPDAGGAGHASNGSRRVLVVDDNRDAAESLADLLTMMGHAVEVAYDGPSAIERARACSPDAVLCDIGLPGMSGYEVAKALRKSGTTAQLFAISGYAQPEDVNQALEAGFDGHVAKPADPEKIERLLS